MNAEAAVARGTACATATTTTPTSSSDRPRRRLTPWEILTDRLDPRLVHLEVDLYWAYTGGVETGAADPLKFAIDVIDDAPQKVRQYHVKDRDGATGDMATWAPASSTSPRIFRSHRVEEYIVENDTPDVTPAHPAAVGHLYLDHAEVLTWPRSY